MERSPASLERRNGLKTTARILTSVIAVGVGVLLAVSQADAQALPGNVGHQGQTPDQQRQRSDDLLARARQAIAENDLDAAEELVEQAESLGVTYPPVYLGDTPAKVRRAIEQARAGNPLDRLLSGFKSGPEVPRQTPFDGRGASGEQVTSLPPVGQVRPVSPPRGPSEDSSARQKSNEHLLEARRALAVGDVRTARQHVEQAKALDLTYGRYDDSPERVSAIIETYENMMQEKSRRGDSEAFRRLYAKLLLEQADGLLRWGDLDEAERLALLAQDQRVNFSPFEVKPQTILERIANERRSQRDLAAGNRPDSPGYSTAAKQRALELVAQGRAALNNGDVQTAETMARRALSMNLPDAAFRSNEDGPSRLMRDIQQAGVGSGVVQAGAQQVVPAAGANSHNRAAAAVYNPSNDPTWNRLANAEQSTRHEQSPTVGMMLVRQAEEALRRNDRASALKFFQKSTEYFDEMDPVTVQRVQDFLTRHAARQASYTQTEGASQAGGAQPDAAAQQQLLVRRIVADIAQREATVRRIRDKDPMRAQDLLDEARMMLVTTSLDSATREQLLTRLDNDMRELDRYIEENQPRIEQERKNFAVQQELKDEQKGKYRLDDELAELVDEFNQLIREQRFAEAEVVAKRAEQLAPDNPLVTQLKLNARFIRQFATNREIGAGKEQGFVDALASVDRSSIPFDDSIPYLMPDATEWAELTRTRKKQLERTRRNRSEREMEIERRLDTPVLMQFEDAPLSQVLEYLAKLAEVNLHLDPQGLSAEGIRTDTPVTINLTQEISLRSALNLILEPLHLAYVIKDDVLKITSEQYRDDQVYVEVYSVADLVSPIPNFNQSDKVGLASAYDDALERIQYPGQPGGMRSSNLLAAGSQGNSSSATINPAVLAQMSSSTPATGSSPSLPFATGGQGAAGGAALADFDSLIDLIQQTIAPTSWDELGGPGSIQPFPTNLSLVISNTQEVHDEIIELLEQLRRIHDLQVTVEVRFITLNDNFFERVGVDFDFDIDDKIDGRRGVQWGQRTFEDEQDAQEFQRDLRDLDNGKGVTVGLAAPGAFSADLDIPFRQGSFGLAVPQFGGYDASAGAQLGFAILSEIEAFFFIEAAQGDRRSNVLQAPKITLYNGQLGTVADQSQSPFVTSVVPVVGDFAAAQQPVIVVLSEGTFLTVQAVVSEDRRFVRLTVVPFFSTIGEVNEFTFTGSETTTESTSAIGNQDDPNDSTSRATDRTTTREGTTVQLPTFAYMSVNTTVSVPDGGTVLLGGIKRLSEGRSEFGVPVLDKIPYVNRLFKNASIGRETQSLMMMVTPRIIIQEEEEEKLGIIP